MAKKTKRTFKTKAERELYKKRVANMAKARAARLKNLRASKSKRKAAVKTDLPTPAQQVANVKKAGKPPIIADAFRLVELRNAFEEAVRADEREQIKARFERATS